MKSFCVLCVKVVQGPIKFDVIDVVPGKMKLWDVEQISNVKVYKYFFVVVELFKSIFKKRKGFIGVDRILCKVNEVKQRSDCPN